jgi:hypothetical protein
MMQKARGIQFYSVLKEITMDAEVIRLLDSVTIPTFTDTAHINTLTPVINIVGYQIVPKKIPQAEKTPIFIKMQCDAFDWKQLTFEIPYPKSPLVTSMTQFNVNLPLMQRCNVFVYAGSHFNRYTPFKILVGFTVAIEW